MPILHFKHVFKLPFISARDRNAPITLGGNIMHFIVYLCSPSPRPVLLLADLSKTCFSGRCHCFLPVKSSGC